MSLVAKLFGRPADCPMCGTPGAKVGFFSDPKCVNFACRFYDAAQVEERETQRMPALPPPDTPSQTACGILEDNQSGVHRVGIARRRSRLFQPADRAVNTNYRGERKTFTADPGSVRDLGGHLSMCVEPTGARIALKRDSISNLASVDRKRWGNR